MRWPWIRFADLFRVKHSYAFKSKFLDSFGPYVLLTLGTLALFDLLMKLDLKDIERLKQVASELLAKLKVEKLRG